MTDFTGTTADLWDDATFEAQEGAYVALEGNIYTATLTVPYFLNGGYRLNSTLTVAAGHTLSLDEGVALDKRGRDIYVDGILRAHNEEVADSLLSTSSRSNIEVCKGGLLDLKNANVNLNGGDTYVRTGASAVIEGGTMCSGFVVEQSATLTMKAADITSGPLSCYGTVDLKNMSIASSVTNRSTGTLKAEGVTFRNWVKAENGIDLTDCRLNSTLTINGTTSDVIVTGCDLSACSLEITGTLDRIIDLSGNYWGTTDEEQIKARIKGYNETYVYLGDILSKVPDSLDETPPVLAWDAPLVEKLENGLVRVNLVWRSNEDVSCELTVDGITYPVKGNSHSIELSLGTHTYSLKATDAAGNSSTLEGEPFTLEGVAPELTLYDLVQTKLDAGGTRVAFTWAANENVVYELCVDGELVYTGEDTAYVMELADGEHRYELQATDRSGNIASVSGAPFTTDTTAPFITLCEPQQEELDNGLTRVTLSWSSNEAATYELIVDGETHEVTGTSKTLNLNEGNYSWSVKATDAYGNSSTVVGPAFTVEGATTPTITRLTHTAQKVGEGQSSVTFSWSATGATRYELTVDGETYELTETSRTLTLADGSHTYSLRALDAANNSVTRSGETFDLNTSASPLKLHAPRMEKRAEGEMDVTLSWTAPAGASLELVVDGRTYTPAGNSHTLTLRDGEHSYSLKATDRYGQVLTEQAVFTTDATAPRTWWCDETLLPAGEGKAQVTFDWSLYHEEGATYTLRLEDELLYSGTGSSYSMVVPDGVYYGYTLEATDAAGNCSSSERSFLAPVIRSVSMSTKPTGKGKTKVTLNWEGGYETDYTIWVDGKKVATLKGGYTTTDFSRSFTVADGEHEYVIKADWASCSLERTGSFVTDAAPPIITLTTPKMSNSGEISWIGEEGATYSVTVDGRHVYTGEKTSVTPQWLLSGKHSYVVTATDAGGKSSTAKGRFTLDLQPPTLSLKEPKFRKSAAGVSKGTLSWKGESGCTYTLSINGQEIELAKKTSYALELRDGSYSYTVKATDAAGNSTEQEGYLALDATAPVVALRDAEVTRYDARQMLVTFHWDGEEGSTYVLKVGSKKYAVGSATSQELLLKYGTQKYSLIATDAFGNTTEVKGSLTGKASKPLLSLIEPTFTKVGEGYVEACFDWVGEEGTRYSLDVDKRSYNAGKDGSYTVRLADGKHSYALTATDAWGQVTTLKGSFKVDATAPSLSLRAPKRTGMDGEQIVHTLSWKGESGASYSLWEGDEELYVGTKTSVSLSLTAGEHEYTLLATDKAGNSSALSFSLVAEAGKKATLREGADYESSPGMPLAAAASSSLDRELALSAGTYYLQVMGVEGANPLASPCTPDLELEKNGSKQPLQQAYLA